VPWLTGYLAIFVGAVATFLMQSSSVFTSALTPLVGMGIISVSRTYPLTLGSNIGTTTTAILAALTASPDKLSDTLQISFCHLFFNITGILLFYPIPFMRWPLPLARGLGRTTAQYRWFAVGYLLLSFVLIPLIVLGLTLAEPNGYALLAVGVPVIVIILFIIIVNVLQTKYSKILPKFMRTWEWIPLFLRSLQPFDKFITKLFSCCKCFNNMNNVEEEMGEDNEAYANMEIE
jgi:sodium-dependent phosphate cotransporter